MHTRDVLHFYLQRQCCQINICYRLELRQSFPINFSFVGIYMRTTTDDAKLYCLVKM